MVKNKQQAPLSFSVLINRHKAEIQRILQAVSFASSKDFPIHERVEERLSELVKALDVLDVLEKQKWELVKRPTGKSINLTSLTLELIRYEIIVDVVQLNNLRCCSWHSPEYYPQEDVFELRLPSGIYVFLRAKHQEMPKLPFDKLKLVKLKNGFTWLSEDVLKRLHLYLNR